jgi:hypothetical protein
MSAWYRPKELSEALELDYVRRPRPLGRWLRRATWAAGAAALICVAWLLWPSHHTALQAGPVAEPHALFGRDCTRCHTNLFATAERFVPGQEAYSVPDQACLQCHPGPAHNPLVAADRCASCHKEHRGHEALARPGDRHCTDCHAHLRTKYGNTCPYEDVADFASHPEFALWRTDRPVDGGNVAFSHKKHLDLRTSHDVNAAEVDRLRHLGCGYCHQPDEAGKYMKPICYDKHCQACHPLLLPADTTPVTEVLRPALRAFQQQPVGHPKPGQGAGYVRAAVLERYGKFAREQGPLLKLQVVPDELWRLAPGLSHPVPPVTPAQLDWVNAQWKNAERLLFDKSAGCALCHPQILKADRELVPELALVRRSKPAIPTRWLPHSVFDHHAHRGLACVACHAGAEMSQSRADVLMPKVSDCRVCHQGGRGAARADCLECHRFHHGGGDWQGRLTASELTGHTGRP